MCGCLLVRSAYLTEFMEYITHYIPLIGSPSFHKYYDKQGAMTAELPGLLTFYILFLEKFIVYVKLRLNYGILGFVFSLAISVLHGYRVFVK